ncbi:MAG: single-stranded DNA-binding protein [Pyrinomonadaceae bacterium MAG19_C2-C3]|nr:single-stranded DNA-binding protein [Pyrinomonadaceae bacterium MAG19_C2-C3]
MSFNKIILVGNLGKDPELRYSTQGIPVCTFSVATNDRRKDRDGEQQDITTWFRVKLFNRMAETASQYLVKGKPVYIEGRLRLEEYTDKEGKQRHSLEVIATDMQFIGSREDAGGGGGYDAGSERSTRPEPNASPSAAGATTGGASQPARNNTPPTNEPDLDDSDIPF